MENIENSHMARLDVSKCHFFNQKKLKVSMVECIMLAVLSELYFTATNVKKYRIKLIYICIHILLLC